MTLVVTRIVYPSILVPYLGGDSGKLPPSLLVDTPGRDGGPLVRLVSPAARSWRAMAEAAARANIVLKATSSADSYRSYEVQKNTFTSRYQLDPIIGAQTKRWQNRTWYKKPGVATAAVPGTSNHGWGLAIDIANASGARLSWLEANAPKYGFSWETVPEEPWHVRLVTGDNTPAAVRAFEAAGEGDMELTDVVWEKTNTDGSKTKRTVGGVLTALDQRTDALTNAERFLVRDKLDEILAAAQDDGNVNVVLDDQSIEALGQVRALIEALPTEPEIEKAVDRQVDQGAHPDSDFPGV